MADMADVLRRIVAQRRVRVEEALESPESIRIPQADPESAGTEASSHAVDFVRALREAPEQAVIAEVKMGSPRLGSLAGRVDPLSQARMYADGGAACLSVVVEPDFFFGSYGLLAHCREASGLPTLAKDFIVHPIQLEWARNAGAAAVLLIASIMSAEELRALAMQARQKGLVPLVECHDQGELARLAGDEWEMVGVNNRDLRSFEVDLARSSSLVPHMPAGCLKVAESGIKSGRDVEALAAAGFDAFLVGESLLLAEDPPAQLRQLVRPGGAS